MVSKQKRIFLNLIDEFLNLLRDGLLLIDSYEISRKLFEVRIRKKNPQIIGQRRKFNLWIRWLDHKVHDAW